MYHNPSAASWKYTNPCANPAVEAFHKTLPDYAVTPLTPLPELAQQLNISHVYLKDESSRLGLPAFKILGASWAIHKAVASKCNLPVTTSLDEMGAAARNAGIELVTCTEGNWGRAVARMAKYMQIKAVIFVPDFMDEATQRKIESEGAKVVVVDGDYDYSIAKAKEEADKGGMLVMDVSWKGYEEIPEWVVEGYMTMLTETDRQLQELGIQKATHAIAAVGVGSWAQAVTMHYKAQSPSATVITVEPDTAASLKASLEAGRVTPISTGNTIMNGMNCGTTSTTAWEVLRQGVDISVTVSDIDVHNDLQYLHSQGIKNGPCGAATMTALKKLCKEQKAKLGLNDNSVVVLFSTEGARDYVTPSKP
ncbi:IlvA Threonine dehydratase [Pyrenophora tritici-repentis]|uniref:IlvA, Threonine dehydratase n=1 Tax=Pyrenophora tritici-repentis TaxID=45151 RepID=A0A2W1HYZ1_9PLEO|nr:IlvA Threonine dehydratase [Pyrenophora tritici-repentis]KAF7455505.1 IlvA Threonine dehydratase [Pyrenophora tritici-repentis]KAF7578711.1 IlvA, Threonine dehydratase [Pyrenophora tritici-repentis]KAG9389257.1 IlvA Threonine dehydratase [Pyrenophora tritici-repentis]KAI0586383.1 IlvA Threonine dehydratase [Pyrenophora tritici-repentis]